MHCAQCGKPLLPDTRFCSACGAPVSAGAATGNTSHTADNWQASGQPPPPPPPGAYAGFAPRLRPELLRPRNGRMIAGVCAAFARTYGWNLVLVRVIVCVAALHVGLGLVAYAIAWITIPEEPYLLPSGRL